jgi:hypothetical protein
MTQTERLRAHLDAGHTVTRLSSYNLLGIFELSARIGELQREGYPITRRTVTVVNRWGEKVRVTEYWRTRDKVAREWTPTEID